MADKPLNPYLLQKILNLFKVSPYSDLRMLSDRDVKVHSLVHNLPYVGEVVEAPKLEQRNFRRLAKALVQQGKVPPVLYHGTTGDALQKINQSGHVKVSRPWGLGSDGSYWTFDPKTPVKMAMEARRTAAVPESKRHAMLQSDPPGMIDNIIKSRLREARYQGGLNQLSDEDKKSLMRLFEKRDAVLRNPSLRVDYLKGKLADVLDLYERRNNVARHYKENRKAGKATLKAVREELTNPEETSSFRTELEGAKLLMSKLNHGLPKSRVLASKMERYQNQLARAQKKPQNLLAVIGAPTEEVIGKSSGSDLYNLLKIATGSLRPKDVYEFVAKEPIASQGLKAQLARNFSREGTIVANSKMVPMQRAAKLAALGKATPLALILGLVGMGALGSYMASGSKPSASAEDTDQQDLAAS